MAAAVAARQAAVDLCQRCALDAASDLKAEDLWFPLLQVCRQKDIIFPLGM